MNMPPPRATRQLGLWMCVALVVGNMIGSGIFLLPASLAPYGVNSLFGWLLTAGKEAVSWGCVLLLIGIPVYLLMRRRQSAAIA